METTGTIQCGAGINTKFNGEKRPVSLQPKFESRLRKNIGKILKPLLPSVGIGNEKSRETWLENRLRSIPQNSRILDAGAGTRRYKRFCDHLNYISQDFGKYNGIGDAAGLQTGEFNYGDLDIISDIVNIPEPDSSFDAIMCIEVLEHVPDPIAAIKEFSRLLKPNGQLIVTAPFCSLTHMAPYHFYSGFNRYFFERHLPAMGLEILEVSPNGDFAEFLGQEIRRLPSIYGRLPLIIQVCYRLLLHHLDKLSKSGKKTDDLLCLGFHVRAVKK